MKLLDAICPLTDEEKLEYLKEWKALSWKIKTLYRFRDFIFWLKNCLLRNKPDTMEVPDGVFTVESRVIKKEK